MSQLQKRQRQAARKGVHVIRWPDGGDWDVFVESETLLGPRGVTRRKRDAVNFAYRISKARRPQPVAVVVCDTPRICLPDPANPGWCIGCNPDNCIGCGNGLPASA